MRAHSLFFVYYQLVKNNRLHYTYTLIIVYFEKLSPPKWRTFGFLILLLKWRSQEVVEGAPLGSFRSTHRWPERTGPEGTDSQAASQVTNDREAGDCRAGLAYLWGGEELTDG